MSYRLINQPLFHPPKVSMDFYSDSFVDLSLLDTRSINVLWMGRSSAWKANQMA